MNEGLVGTRCAASHLSAVGGGGREARSLPRNETRKRSASPSPTFKPDAAQRVPTKWERRKRRMRATFETGTGYDPDLLARRAAWELRALIRHPRYDHAMDTIIELVSARAERVWAAQPFWRKRWRQAGRADNAAPLMLFFRHWAHAAAVREGCGKWEGGAAPFETQRASSLMAQRQRSSHR